MMLRLCCVVKVPGVGVVKMSEPSGFLMLNHSLPSVPVLEKLPLALRLAPGVTLRNCGPLPGPTPAMSLPVVTESGGPDWNW